MGDEAKPRVLVIGGGNCSRRLLAQIAEEAASGSFDVVVVDEETDVPKRKQVNVGTIGHSGFGSLFAIRAGLAVADFNFAKEPKYEAPWGKRQRRKPGGIRQNLKNRR